MNKTQLNQIAELIRTTPKESEPSVIWTVKYHLSLFVLGLEDAEDTINNLILACNSMREDNIMKRIGFDELEKCRGQKLVKIAKYDNLFVLRESETL